MAKKKPITNYFPYSVPVGFYMHYWAGALYGSDLVKLLIDEYEEHYHEHYIYTENLAKLTTRGLHDIKAIYQQIANMENELTEKTLKLEDEKPTNIAYFYIPSHADAEGGFTLCALTRVDNNGQVYIFAPEREYLKVYGEEYIREW